MAHPLRSETNASRAAKLKSMTEDYGDADPAMKQLASVNKYKKEGGEEDIGYGADNDKPKLHGARVTRMTKPTNPYATYKRGGRVKHRASGGDTSDIEQADIDQKLESRRHGGRTKAKRRADGGSLDKMGPPSDYTLGTGDKMMISKPDTTGDKMGITNQDAQGRLTSGPLKGLVPKKRGGSVKRAGGGGLGMTDEDFEDGIGLTDEAVVNPKSGPTPQPRQPLKPTPQKPQPKRAHGGRVRGEMGPKTIYPGPVKMGAKYATESSEPSPTPVDNRARGGRTGGKKKGGTHVNIMIAPQHPQPPPGLPLGGNPALPPPPMGAKPPMGPPPGAMGPGPGGPPMPGAMPPGMPPPGAIPPGAMPPRKRGGRIMAKKHGDADEDMNLIKRTVKQSALKPHGSMRAAGGRIGLTAGAASGEGRLEKAAANKRIAPQKV